MSQLSPAERDQWVLQKRYEHGWTVSRIARYLGITQRQVYRHLARLKPNPNPTPRHRMPKRRSHLSTSLSSTFNV